MTGFVNRIKEHTVFFLAYLFVMIAGIILLIAKGKAGSFLLLNTWHAKWADHFFIYYTDLGDGFVAVPCCLLLFFIAKKKKLAVVLLLAYCFTGIVAQVIKPIVESPRPETYFSPQHFSFFIDEIMHNGNTSFPSGHTVSAFALATVLVFFTEKKWQHLSLLIVAVSVGFSRIYLSQHFLTDVLAGSLLGVLGSLLCIYWCRNIDEDKLVFKKRPKTES